MSKKCLVRNIQTGETRTVKQYNNWTYVDAKGNSLHKSAWRVVQLMEA